MNEVEINILNFIQDHLSSRVGDVIIPIITALGNGGILWIVLTLIFLINKKTRKYGIVMCVSLIIESVLCNLLLKPLVARTRPFNVNTTIELLVARPRDYSFPSGHTGASFATAGALFFSKHKSWILVTVLAILIGFSRLYLYVHYPTDIFVGAILGIISGYVAAKVVLRKYEEKESKSNVQTETK